MPFTATWMDLEEEDFYVGSLGTPHLYSMPPPSPALGPPCYSIASTLCHPHESSLLWENNLHRISVFPPRAVS